MQHDAELALIAGGGDADITKLAFAKTIAEFALGEVMDGVFDAVRDFDAKEFIFDAEGIGHFGRAFFADGGDLL